MSTPAKPGLPPGPKGRWRPTLKLIRSPRAAFEQWTREFGDPFFMHALNGPVVITGRPELIQEIFAQDPMQYDVFAERALRPMLGSGSMLLLAGIEHRRERKLVMPLFHGDRMRAYAHIMRDTAMRQLESCGSSAFNMLDITTRVSLEIIVQTIFGGENREAIERFMRLSRQLIRRSSPLLFFSPKMHFKFLGLSPWDRFCKAQSELREAYDREMLRREAAPAERQDILTLLMASKYDDGSSIDPEHLKDELGTFLFAGHETSALAMAWAFYHLHRNPEQLARLQEQLQAMQDPSPEELAQLPYLKAVVQETLRLHPIVTEVLRVLKRPMQLDGYTLPAGMAVAPAVVLAHYRSETFPEPDKFLPERFLERSYSSSEYLPFGGGHRRCAGAAFATYEMAIVLGSILRTYRLELLETKELVPARRNVTMGPSSGVRMRVAGKR